MTKGNSDEYKKYLQKSPMVFMAILGNLAFTRPYSWIDWQTGCGNIRPFVHDNRGDRKHHHHRFTRRYTHHHRRIFTCDPWIVLGDDWEKWFNYSGRLTNINRIGNPYSPETKRRNNSQATKHKPNPIRAKPPNKIGSGGFPRNAISLNKIIP